MGPHALDLAPFWPRLTIGFVAAGLTWVVAADAGVAIVRRWIDFENLVARRAVGAALGYALIGSGVALLGLVHAATPLVMWLLLGVALLVRVPAHARRFRALLNTSLRALSRWRQFDPVTVALCAVSALAIATGLIAAALPAVWWDPIAYHLPLAAAALAHGSFTFSPAMVQTGFPQLGEAAALPAYALAGSAGAAMVTLGAGVCLALLVSALAEKFAPRTGACAAMLVFSSGLWLWLAPSFYVDVPFAMFAVAALAVVALSQTLTPSTTFVAGELSGAAAAVKYSGLGVFVVVLVFVILSRPKTRAFATAALCAGTLLLAVGWYARSLLLTGDPLYPFLATHLAHSAMLRAFAERYVDMTRHWCGGGTSFVDLLALPYRLIAAPRNYCGDPGLALRTGFIFALAAAIWVRGALWLALATVAFTLGWFFGSQQWRFALTPVSTFAVLVAVGTSVLGDRLRSVATIALCLLGAYGVAVNWLPATRTAAPQSIVPAFEYLAGKMTAEQYLNMRLETFASAQWLVEHHIPASQILALDDVRDYYFPAGTVWGNPFYQPALAVDWLEPAPTRYQRLRNLGFRYVVVNANEAYTHRTPTGIDWAALARDEGIWLRSAFSANGVTIYRIESKAPLRGARRSAKPAA